MGIARFFFLKKKKKVVVNSNLNVVTRNYTHTCIFFFLFPGKWWWLQWSVRYKDGARWYGFFGFHEGKPSLSYYYYILSIYSP